MPILNGDSMEGSVPVLEKAKILDFHTAAEVLHKEYPQRDGIDVRTLLDSKINGGLTYNDFLILPGYIGRQLRKPGALLLAACLLPLQASQPMPFRPTPQSPSASPSRLPSSPLPWTP